MSHAVSFPFEDLLEELQPEVVAQMTPLSSALFCLTNKTNYIKFKSNRLATSSLFIPASEEGGATLLLELISNFCPRSIHLLTDMERFYFYNLEYILNSAVNRGDLPLIRSLVTALPGPILFDDFSLIGRSVAFQAAKQGQDDIVNYILDLSCHNPVVKAHILNGEAACGRLDRFVAKDFVLPTNRQHVRPVVQFAVEHGQIEVRMC